jgi:hypothetical protein
MSLLPGLWIVVVADYYRPDPIGAFFALIPYFCGFFVFFYVILFVLRAVKRRLFPKKRKKEMPLPPAFHWGSIGHF